MKLGVILDDVEVRAIRLDRYELFVYQNGTPSLRVQSSGSMTDMVIRLSERMQGPWYVLYVLLTPRGDHEPGRYQGIEIENHVDLAIFLAKYRDYFDGDGRHHLWVGSAVNGDLVVYDHHDIIIAYGPIHSYLSLLGGFSSHPIPGGGAHTPHYNPEFDAAEDAILKEWPWQHYPLQDSDDP